MITDKFPVEVHLLDSVTNKRSVYKTDELIIDNEEWSDYIWAEGNNACDHNRVLFWNESCNMGDEVDESFVGCNTERFIIEKIIDLRTGEIIYTEGDL